MSSIDKDQWTDSTPCPEWNVRTLVNHLVLGNRISAGILSGAEHPQPETIKQLRATDQLGDDPKGAFRNAAATLVAAFRRPGVMETEFAAPVGRVPGAVLLHLRITQALVHDWSLARATRQLAQSSEDVAEEELTFATGPGSPQVPRTGHPFGPIQSVQEDAPAIDRLAAYLGRPPGSI